MRHQSKLNIVFFALLAGCAADMGDGPEDCERCDEQATSSHAADIAACEAEFSAEANARDGDRRDREPLDIEAQFVERYDQYRSCLAKANDGVMNGIAQQLGEQGSRIDGSLAADAFLQYRESNMCNMVAASTSADGELFQANEAQCQAESEAGLAKLVASFVNMGAERPEPPRSEGPFADCYEAFADKMENVVIRGNNFDGDAFKIVVSELAGCTETTLSAMQPDIVTAWQETLDFIGAESDADLDVEVAGHFEAHTKAAFQLCETFGEAKPDFDRSVEEVRDLCRAAAAALTSDTMVLWYGEAE